LIFVTIGSMFPFDRLIREMDRWAAEAGRNDVFAQIGNGTYLPQNMKYTRSLSQADFTTTMAKAELIVAHAGMGTVITAGQAGNPLVLLPRIQAWGEHTSDHQIATANWLRDKQGIFLADTDADLPGAIVSALNYKTDGQSRFADVADPAFTNKIRTAILDFKK